MNEWKQVFLLARRSLMVFTVAVLLGMASVFGLGVLADNLKGEVAQLTGAMQEQQTQLDAKQADLLNMQTHIRRYEALRSQGLVGEPDRALWVELLQESHRQLGLPGVITVQLQGARPLAAGAAVAVPAAEVSPTAPLVHDLQFEIRDSLETDVLALIEDYRTKVKGRFRVNACKLQDPKDSGLTVQCVLRFISLPLASEIVPSS